jgi:hypothetical protein
LLSENSTHLKDESECNTLARFALSLIMDHNSIVLEVRAQGKYYVTDDRSQIIEHSGANALRLFW